MTAVPAYSITEADVVDPDGLRRYVELSSAAVHRYGGHYLVRGEPTAAEGTWPAARRLIVIAFPDMTALRAWYDSPEYAPARAVAAGAVRRRVLFVEGTAEPAGVPDPHLVENGGTR